MEKLIVFLSGNLLALHKQTNHDFQGNYALLKVEHKDTLSKILSINIYYQQNIKTKNAYFLPRTCTIKDHLGMRYTSQLLWSLYMVYPTSVPLLHTMAYQQYKGHLHPSLIVTVKVIMITTISGLPGHQMCDQNDKDY